MTNNLTRAYLAEKTSASWDQPMRRWTDAFAPSSRSVLINKTPEHDRLVHDIHERAVAAAVAQYRLSLNEVDTITITNSRYAQSTSYIGPIGRHQKIRWYKRLITRSK